MPLTPADVRNKQFSTTRLRPGYDEEEVDAFLDEVEAELDRLIQENEELRAKLAECLRGKPVQQGMAMPMSQSMASAPVAEPKPEMMIPPEPMKPPEPVRPEPVPMGMGMPPVEDNMDTAARVLALAQQTADQAIADARREADETVTRARREASSRPLSLVMRTFGLVQNGISLVSYGALLIAFSPSRTGSFAT